MHSTILTPRPDIPTPCLFLDRDGTVNVEKNYLYKIADWEWTPGAREAIVRANQAGFLVVIVSNQAGIAHGYYTPRDVNLLHDFVQTELQKIGAHIDAFYYCAHEAKDRCGCRKPEPLMLQHSAHKLNVDLTRSYMIGDKVIDVQAGMRAGVTPLLVRTGHGETEAPNAPSGTRIVANLAEAVAQILP